ncbi:unnamed protein product [Sphacelaria rigidula]
MCFFYVLGRFRGETRRKATDLLSSRPRFRMYLGAKSSAGPLFYFARCALTASSFLTGQNLF